LKLILVATLTAFLLSPGGAAAETFTERLLHSDMQTHPDWSVLFMDVKMLEEGKDRGGCIEMSVNAVSDEGRSKIFFAGLAFLPPGTYTIVSVTCKYTARLNGKFARFRVGRNEVINAGRLVIDFTKSPFSLFARRTFTGRTGVEDLSARAVQSLTERVPSVFPKATKRYLTPNPATSGKRPS
jgi:hypothetical protein